MLRRAHFVRSYSTLSSVSNFLDQLKNRGILFDKTASFDRIVTAPESREKCGIYVGFDPTADGLHIGNLLVLQTLNRFQQEGGFRNIFALIGGATGMIGDPSGKRTERSLLQEEKLLHNVFCLKQEIERFFVSSGTHVTVVNNADWLSPMNMIEFLRDVGKFFQVNNMMRLESVKSRIGNEGSTGMTFTEFSYSLLQSYDFYHLHRNHGINIQIGGSDQWGNITSGIDFIRRKSFVNESSESESSAAGMTVPLLVTSDGIKFGKSEGNAVWLNPNKTSPFEFYQYFMRTKDQDVGRFLRMLTLLPLEEILDIEKQHNEQPEKWLAQRTLARELIKQIHGPQVEEKVRTCSEMLFGSTESDRESSNDKKIDTLKSLARRDVQSLLHDAPKSILPENIVLSEPLSSLLKIAQVFKSSSEARRMIQSGGLYINYRREQSPHYKLTREDFIADGQLVLVRSGKKNYHLIEIQRI